MEFLLKITENDFRMSEDLLKYTTLEEIEVIRRICQKIGKTKICSKVDKQNVSLRRGVLLYRKGGGNIE